MARHVQQPPGHIAPTQAELEAAAKQAGLKSYSPELVGDLYNYASGGKLLTPSAYLPQARAAAKAILTDKEFKNEHNLPLDALETELTHNELWYHRSMSDFISGVDLSWFPGETPLEQSMQMLKLLQDMGESAGSGKDGKPQLGREQASQISEVQREVDKLTPEERKLLQPKKKQKNPFKLDLGPKRESEDGKPSNGKGKDPKATKDGQPGSTPGGGKPDPKGKQQKDESGGGSDANMPNEQREQRESGSGSSDKQGERTTSGGTEESKDKPDPDRREEQPGDGTQTPGENENGAPGSGNGNAGERRENDRTEASNRDASNGAEQETAAEKPEEQNEPSGKRQGAPEDGSRQRKQPQDGESKERTGAANQQSGERSSQRQDRDNPQEQPQSGQSGEQSGKQSSRKEDSSKPEEQPKPDPSDGHSEEQPSRKEDSSNPEQAGGQNGEQADAKESTPESDAQPGSGSSAEKSAEEDKQSQSGAGAGNPSPQGEDKEQEQDSYSEAGGPQSGSSHNRLQARSVAQDTDRLELAQGLLPGGKLRAMLDMSRQLDMFESVRLSKRQGTLPDPEGEEVRRRPMKDMSEFGRLVPAELSLRTVSRTLFRYRLATHKCLVRERLKHFMRKQIVFILLDGSGSMGSAGKHWRASGVVMNRLKAVIAGDAELWLSVFDTSMSKVHHAATEAEAQDVIAKFMAGSYTGGGTNIGGSVLAAHQYIQKLMESRDDLERPQIWVLTDEDESIKNIKPSQVAGSKVNAMVFAAGNKSLCEFAKATGGLAFDKM